MTDLPSIFLPLYFLTYFGVAFVLKRIKVARQTGKSPFVLPNDDSAYGLIGFYFKWLLIALFIYVIVFPFALTGLKIQLFLIMRYLIYWHRMPHFCADLDHHCSKPHA